MRAFLSLEPCVDAFWSRPPGSAFSALVSVEVPGAHGVAYGLGMDSGELGGFYRVQPASVSSFGVGRRLVRMA